MTLANSALFAAEREVLQEDFKLFVREAWPHIDNKKFKGNWHIDAICDHLQAVAEGDIKRLLINIPPGAGKSLLASVLYPAWVWTRQANHQFISTSFSVKRSTRDSRKMRKLVQSKWYQDRWPIQFSADQSEKINFENTAGGSRVAEAFTGMTGSRGNTIIIDDPHSVDMAASVAQREDTVETFLEAIPNRINDPDEDNIIVIMQRLHEEDVSGVILDRPELGYDHLCISMEYEGPRKPTSIGWTDPRSEDGELMFPKHFSPNAVSALKSSLGKIAYAGQYQQNPVPRQAGEIDTRWFNRYKLGDHPPSCNFYLTSDHAPGGSGDYNVFRMWGYDAQRNLWLVDSFRKRCSMQEAFGIKRDVEGKITVMPIGAIRMIQRWKPKGYFPEDDNTWKAVRELFVQALKESNTRVRIEPQPTSGMGDKVNKAQGYIAVASLGQVYIPNGPIGDDTLDEYARFPNGKHDDQVDADGMIGRVLTDLKPGRAMTIQEAIMKNRDYGPSSTTVGDDSSTFWI